ncbi:hypothetical protein GGE68_004457 [Rhizobium leguminosarum]|uniref:hypothetical protein n=1 Tax=Rhizobium leguminosarum TaxID=384 RepID=UPI00161C1979|nr:hypothetical protein [Rhizobium leguminosarum]MBB5666227.1 hypothetical protein [Rhizobium leguminosarum]
MNGDEKVSRQLRQLEDMRRVAQPSRPLPSLTILLKCAVNHVIDGGRKRLLCFHL